MSDNNSFTSHFIELRSRLIKSIIFIFLIFIISYTFAEHIYAFLVNPYAEAVKDDPTSRRLIFTALHETFITYLKVAFFAAVFLGSPILLIQIYKFIAPGLYKKEKRFALPILLSSIILFYIGIAFSFFVVFPLVFGFFTSVAPTGVTIMTDINRYLDFVLKLFFAFGIAFEIPIATLLLIWSGATSAANLKRKRPYVIVGCFIIGMLLTPPDIISQILLAIPMWALFELGIIFSILMKKREEATSTPP